MAQNLSIIVQSTEHQFKVLLPISMVESDWSLMQSNALIFAAQEFHRHQTGCPECALGVIVEIILSGMTHFQQKNTRSIIVDDQVMAKDDHEAMSRAVLTVLGFAIMSQGEMPRPTRGKDVLIDVDDIVFPHYLHNHARSEQNQVRTTETVH